ncbi:MAG: SIR2 family protein [Actinomycetota bacterium]|nr:SIR2 family protein [Actinomycetota bacterium]
MADPLETLASRMVTSRAVGFVGAGCSAQLGYPTWDELIEALYERASAYAKVPEPKSGSDQRWLAEVYAEELNRRGSLQETMRGVFEESDTKELDRFHLLLARLPFNHFITTNYDKLIEQACDLVFELDNDRKPFEKERCVTRDGRSGASFSEFLGSFSRESRRSVLHLHGTLEGDNLTLSLGDYDAQYLHDAMLLRMFTIFATGTVVFLGASLNDLDLMELVRRSTYHAGGRQRHYAFLPDERRSEQGMLRRSYGIEPIFYSTDDNHAELERRLERLLELVEPKRRDPSKEAGGNAHPVDVSYGQRFGRTVDRVKDEIRRVRLGPARFSGLSDVASSRVLRRIASDYRALPASYRFRHVIWISPGRIGLFPDSQRSRQVVDSMIGEIIYSLGRHRVTATIDRAQNLRSIGRVLGEHRWKKRAEPTLLVIDGFDELRASAEDKEAIDSLVSSLPYESIAIFRRPKTDVTPTSDSSTVDPFPEEELSKIDDATWAMATYHKALTSLVDNDSEPDDHARRILTALCVVATPIASDQLGMMLEIGKVEVDRTLAILGERGLVEGFGLNGKEADNKTALNRSIREDPAVRSVGILAPIRTAVLTDHRYRTTVVEVVRRLLAWSESTVDGFSRWEEDNAQLDQLTFHLPNVLATFEAACWLSSPGTESDLDQMTVDRHLWLGTDLAYILYNVGRWAEAEQLLRYLTGRADRASEKDTFRREVLILQAGYYGHAGRPDKDYNRAIEQAREVVDLANECVRIGATEHEIPTNTYAPNRLTLARQRARALIRLGQALVRKGELDEAEEVLKSVCDGQFNDGDSERESQYESVKIVADAAQALGGVRLAQLRDIDSSTPPEAKAILEELDRGRAAMKRLRSRRARGYHARLRGDILLEFGNTAAARRYHARALLVSFEFRDRYLEAGASVGLAQSDHRRSLANRAADIFQDLKRPEEKDRAEYTAYRLPQGEDEATRPLRYPTLLLFVGLPGSGKTIAVQTAAATLGRWGYSPVLTRFKPTLIEEIRSGEPLDLGEVHSQLEDNVREREEVSSERLVIAKIPTGRLQELFEPWSKNETLLRNMLCIHLHAPEEVLITRNEQRRSGQLAGDVLERMMDDENHQSPDMLGASSWEAWFQRNGSAYVSVASDVSIFELEETIQDVLRLSYLAVEELKAGGSRLAGFTG